MTATLKSASISHMSKPIVRTKRARTITYPVNSDGFAPRSESVADFVRRGGKIAKCEARPAGNAISGSFQVDGEICVTVLGSPEYIPNYVVSEQTYDAAQYDQPDVLIAPVCRESELQSLPSDLRVLAETRTADTTEWAGDELYTDYFDEVEPE